MVEGACRGLSTREIAFSLDLADYTVQDHLESVFQKVGVRSRKQLVATLINDRSLPEVHAGATPSPYGWFLAGADSGSGIGP